MRRTVAVLAIVGPVLFSQAATAQQPSVEDLIRKIEALQRRVDQRVRTKVVGSSGGVR